ncbi:hypothetical protein KFK09_011863 [Dendrobium nobile]|uniref:Uncharacterized protein n=1 Tax=Dendrobium nobile TaxID=94219 RepID=A0A8T3BJE3_DENNO|nr:hypothetical protein KFK09_021591 [Dendrobium nobile]KAI0511238.1 hypothetical protein KFK09_011863 [Dendrobium nobile]
MRGRRREGLVRLCLGSDERTTEHRQTRHLLGRSREKRDERLNDACSYLGHEEAK